MEDRFWRDGRIIGLVGAFLLFLGPFMPVIRVPLLGTMDYVRGGSGDGMFLVVMALVGGFFAFLGWSRGQIVMGGLSLLALCVGFVDISFKIVDLQEQTRREMAGNPFGGLAMAMVHSVGLEWGWVPMFLGAGLMLAGGVVSHRSAAGRPPSPGARPSGS